jgi:hypothetical protein
VPQAAQVRSGFMESPPGGILEMHRQLSLVILPPASHLAVIARAVKEILVMKRRRVSLSGAKFGLERLLPRVKAGARMNIACRVRTPVAAPTPTSR